jgi:hypothetical protein
MGLLIESVQFVSFSEDFSTRFDFFVVSRGSVFLIAFVLGTTV